MFYASDEARVNCLINFLEADEQFNYKQNNTNPLIITDNNFLGQYIKRRRLLRNEQIETLKTQIDNVLSQKEDPRYAIQFGLIEPFINIKLAI